MMDRSYGGRMKNAARGAFGALFCAGLAFCSGAASAAAEQKAYVGEMKTITTRYEDTMVEIARANDIGFNELRSANPYVDPWMPGAGVRLVLPTQHILPNAARRGIVINLPEMRIYLYNADGTLQQTHPIGVGREGLSTPVGQTTVVRKVVGPIWRPTDRMRKEHPELPVEVGPGPDNPMGTHALYLGWPQYAIHGTDKPYAIGRRASSGCIRMYPEDIVNVYPQVPVGATVTVVNQPVKAAWIGGKLYVEAHPPLDQAMMIEENGGRPYYDMTDDDMRRILDVAGDRANLLEWSRIRSVIRNRQGYPVQVAEDGAAADAADAGVPSGAANGDDDANANANADTDTNTVRDAADAAGKPVYGPERGKLAEQTGKPEDAKPLKHGQPKPTSRPAAKAEQEDNSAPPAVKAEQPPAKAREAFQYNVNG